LKSLRLDGLLSFPPGSEPIELQLFNVLIGPNGSGKSTLIEGIELLHATPTGFASAIREGGDIREWLWKGDDAGGIGTIEASVEDYSFDPSPPLIEGRRPDLPLTLRYKLSFVEFGHRVEIADEIIEDDTTNSDEVMDARFHYRFPEGHPIVKARIVPGIYTRTDNRAKREFDR
jgi:predicted ATPase